MRKYSTTVVCVLLLLLCPARLHAQDRNTWAALDARVGKIKRETGDRSGIAIAVVKDGRIVHQAYLGYADISQGKQVDADTRFYIASATKPFTALMTLIRTERGEWRDDMSMAGMFPDLNFNGFDASTVTMRDLLTHTSGLENTPLVWALAYSGIHDAASRYQLVQMTQPLPDQERTGFRYGNVGYNLVSVWMEQRFQSTWQRQLEQLVLRPLGLRHTTARISDARRGRHLVAKPYSVLSESTVQPLYLEKSDATMHAAGGLMSTAPDLARFLIVQLEDGRIDGQQVVPAGVIRKSHVPVAKTDGKPYQQFDRQGYAWGWYTGDYKGQQMLHHFGGFAGFHAHLSFMPDAGIGLVVLSNEEYMSPKLTGLVADYVYGALLGEDEVGARMDLGGEQLMAEMRALAPKIAARRQAMSERAWQLSLPLQTYMGRYTHPLLGEMNVQKDDDSRPLITWGALKSVATAYERPDSVRVEFVPNSGNVVEFDVQGSDVVALRFEGMVFTKH